jgi:ABC-type bacteriocin/lantibiotic exporter with double-glycine peptidase domain
MTIGQAVALNFFTAQILSPLAEVIKSYPMANRLRNSLERIDDVFSSRTEEFGRSPAFIPAREPSRLKGVIEFRQVSFRYGGDVSPMVLQNISFRCSAGESIGVAGSSGSGKSSLVALIGALQIPNQGQVLMDGVDAQKYPLAWLRGQIGFVMQDHPLLASSILENISLGDESASLEMAKEAAQLAELHDFIERLPRKYETVLGPLGEGLSGGQKQRLSIARALYRKPPILILDEATSSLDSITEDSIMRNIIGASFLPTTIIVSHRQNALRHAKRIFFVNRDGLEVATGVTELKARGWR